MSASVKFLQSFGKPGSATHDPPKGASAAPSPPLQAAEPAAAVAAASQPKLGWHQTRVLMTHFAKVLTKHGMRGDPVLARVSMHLRHRYGVSNAVEQAIDAIKPVLKYVKHRGARKHMPMVLRPKTATGTALRWVVQQASARTYGNERPCLERGLIDELDEILQGTSSLYAKRYAYHKNPN